MALHDPDISAAEEGIVLNIGRQNKIKFIDEQQVEEHFVDVNEVEEHVVDVKQVEEHMVDVKGGIPFMQGEVGQQYVILEVIQLPEQGVVQVRPSGFQPPTTRRNQRTPPSSSLSVEDIKIKKEQERANCFGFDDDSDLKNKANWQLRKKTSVIWCG